MTAVDASLFLVVHRLLSITEPELALLHAAISAACTRLTARGEPVHYLGSTLLPGPERLLSVEFWSAS